jgi:hypothetical protein
VALAGAPLSPACTGRYAAVPLSESGCPSDSHGQIKLEVAHELASEGPRLVFTMKSYGCTS